MAQPQIGHQTTTVSTSVILLFEAPTNYGQIRLYLNNEGGSKCYIGDSSVSTTGADEGYNMDNGDILSMILNGGEQIYAVSAATSKMCLLWSL